MKKIVAVLLVLAALSSQTVYAGSISGVVTAEANAVPMQNIWIYAYHYQTHAYAGAAQTNQQGVYTLTGLAEGTYCVVFWGNDLYAQQCYNGVCNWDYAAPVSVASAGTTENINFSLALAGTITGTVKDVNGSPINGIMINAHCDALGLGRSDYTDENGMYKLTGLPAGDYRAELATWDASSGNYVKQYYDHTVYWDQVTPVHVQPGQEITSIDFDPMPGASLSGYVKDPNGIGVEGTEVVSFLGDEWFVNTFTDASGFYRLRGLIAGHAYRIAAYPPGSTDYMITRIFVDIPDINDHIAADINLQRGALTASGRVTDKTTSQPLAGIRVCCNFDDLDLWGGSTLTDANGRYTLTNLIPGEYLEIWTEPLSQYARIGAEIELEHDIYDMDFALPPAATLSGRVIDAATAEPIANVRVTYDNDRYNCWMNTFTDTEGQFSITSLPDGIAEVIVRPFTASGYAWSLPWGSSWFYLDEGQCKSDRIIALHRGALVKGNVKYPDNSPASYIEIFYGGAITEGWLDTDTNGHYEIVLPFGEYVVAVDYDEDQLSSLPVYVTITNPNQTVVLPDIIAYNDSSGQTISGVVTSGIGSPAPAIFWITAFPTGTIPEPNNIRTTTSAGSGCDLDSNGPFEITALPPGSNYDICLFIEQDQSDGIESVAMRDVAVNIAPGSGGVNLSCNSAGATITGTVVNVDGRPVLGACVVLNDSTTGAFGGLADVNESGEYSIYNIAPGTYTATATHSKYLNASVTVSASEGAIAQADMIVLPFAGDKEGPNLNGDSSVNMQDFAELASQWMQSGTADFTLDGSVEFDDLARFVENWLWRPIWYND